MSQIGDLAESILDWHDRLGSPLRHYLRPGVSAADVEVRFRESGLHAGLPTDRLAELYS